MVLLVQVFLHFAMSVQGMFIYYFLKETLQLGDYVETFWGYLLSAMGLGGLVGSFILGALIKNNRNRFTLFLNVLLADAAVPALLLLNRYLAISLPLFSLPAISFAAHQIVINSILQKEVSDQQRGRVFSIMGIAAGPVGAFYNLPERWLFLISQPEMFSF